MRTGSCWLCRPRLAAHLLARSAFFRGALSLGFRCGSLTPPHRLPLLSSQQRTELQVRGPWSSFKLTVLRTRAYSFCSFSSSEIKSAPKSRLQPAACTTESLGPSHLHTAVSRSQPLHPGAPNAQRSPRTGNLAYHPGHPPLIWFYHPPSTRIGTPRIARDTTPRKLTSHKNPRCAGLLKRTNNSQKRTNSSH